MVVIIENMGLGKNQPKKEHKEIKYERENWKIRLDWCISSGCPIKCHRLVGLNDRNLFSHNSGGWKSKVRVPEWSGSGEGPPPASWFTYGHLLAVSLRGGERGIGLLMD